MAIHQFTSSALIYHNDQFLVIWHEKLGMWLYPGGHVENDEDPVEALMREVQEEVGISIEILPSSHVNSTLRLALSSANVTELAQPILILKEPVKDSKDGEHFHVDLIYLCKPISMPSFEQNSSMRWISVEECKNILTPPEFPALLDYASKLIVSE